MVSVVWLSWLTDGLMSSSANFGYLTLNPTIAMHRLIHETRTGKLTLVKGVIMAKNETEKVAVKKAGKCIGVLRNIDFKAVAGDGHAQGFILLSKDGKSVVIVGKTALVHSADGSMIRTVDDAPTFTGVEGRPDVEKMLKAYTLMSGCKLLEQGKSDKRRTRKGADLSDF